MQNKPGILAQAVRLGIIATAIAAGPAWARDAKFDVAGGTLEQALPEFARQAGLQVIAPASDPTSSTVEVPPLVGRMDTRVALAQLIAGTGLRVAADDGDTITLYRPQMLASLGGAGALNTVAMAQAGQSTVAPVQVEPEAAAAQSRPDVATLDQVTVVGTQIRGSNATAILPVVTLQAEQIEATGAVSGDDLFRSIPQMGDVSFVGTNGGNSSNYARGDIASVNLRGLGVGNTLLLINGRRTVVHPTSQADSALVPVLTYNANAIPVGNLQRFEVLLDGAAAIYGTDAVAGVVNNVLRDDIHGGEITVQGGVGEGTGLRDFGVSGIVGRNTDDLRGNVTLSFNHYRTTGIDSLDQDWTATADRRFDFVGTPFEGIGTLDSRHATSAWGNYTTGTPVMRNGELVTSAAGAFHVQPVSNPDCAAELGDGNCVASGSKASSGADRNLRSDAQAQWPLSLTPEVRRTNLFLTSKWDFDSGITFFSELGYYHADADSLQMPVNSIGALPVVVPASNYWNPFGSSASPNRLEGLDVGPDGLPVTISSYRFERPTRIQVENQQVRALAGLRGYHHGFDWESALLYSQARVVDTQQAVSMTRFQQALADPTADAYNPFCGGCNDDRVLDRFYVDAVRESRTGLSLWDLKASRPDLFALPAGEVGLAMGVEARHERQRDDRDPRVDGTLTYVDAVTGAEMPSDMYGVSPTPDTEGSRTVTAAFAELSVPLVAPGMEVPLVRSLDLQLAGRAERYSDFGSVAKPKLALGWEVVDGLRVRASWAEGFRAPNLEQVNATLVSRSNTRTDYIQCEADVRSGASDAFTNCGHSTSTTARRSGNPDLKPETSTNTSAGLVWQPRFLPEAAGQWSFSVDYFKYDQEDIVGLYGEGNALILDYLLRTQGSSNPEVVRADPTVDDIARYEGTGLDPAGRVLYVNDRYVNMQPQTVRGIDYGMSWRSAQTRFGEFGLTVNGTRVLEFYRDLSPDIQVLADARDAGLIDGSVWVAGGGDLIGQNGMPEWKWSSTATWRLGGLSLGGSVRYTGAVTDTWLSDSDGNQWRIDSQTLANLFGRYEFSGGGALDGLAVKLGVNNVADKRPPVSSSAYGYQSGLYQPYPRYWYMSVSKKF
ncbi:TonB-dependent receptor [Lysobacter sp. GX 14042]|uniref:TonB-dependent receptor n=1 Tax=Lysobacter sp. GX 14042 TaxID=2907155 RepID=UPI001F1F8FC7|nr:TonB-dependent receptor [Lysobacter sp. GX 14042]MCE7032540.1 TonB-dependent receptor [Lysobacter sp. GX 14042]